MPRPVEGSSPYNAGLDGIRALAVLGVIAYHLGFGWASGGLLGVGVFFVLSGYLITDLILGQLRRDGPSSMKQFWLRRARRLLPALFVMLALTVAWVTLFDRSQLPGLRADVLPAAFYYSNWWYIFRHVSYFAEFGPPSPVGHLWSLAIEEQFYVVWPLVLMAATRWVRDRRVLVSAVVTMAAASAIEMALLYVPYTDPTRVYDGTDTRAFELLIGASLALVLPRGRRYGPVTRQARTILEAVGGAAALGIVVMYWRIGQYDPFAYRGGMVLLSVTTAVLIAVCVHPGARVANVLGTAPLRWLGERSYGIYLWSLPVIVLTTPAGTRPGIVRGMLQVVAMLVLAAVSWRFVEQPVRHGAVGRLVSSARARRRRGGLRSLRPGAAQWAAATATIALAVVCALGLGGVVPGGSAPSEAATSILPTAHRVTTGPRPGSPTSTLAPLWVGWELHLAPPMGSVPAPLPGSSGATAPGGPLAGQGVTVFGDSIMLDVAPYLRSMLPRAVVDAQIGWQLADAQVQVPQLESRGLIGDRVVVELGTNGYFSVTQLETFLRAIGPMARVVLVNTYETRPWEQAVNQTIATVANAWPGAVMVNWNAIATNNPSYLYPDGVHLDPTGAQRFARLVVRALGTRPPLP